MTVSPSLCGNISTLRSSAIKSTYMSIVGIKNSLPITLNLYSVSMFIHALSQQVMSLEPLSALLSQESRILISSSRTPSGLSSTILLASRVQLIHIHTPLEATPVASRTS